MLATRHIKEILENLYDEKNLIDEQWIVRQDHLVKTLNFRIFQKDTGKVSVIIMGVVYIICVCRYCPGLLTWVIPFSLEEVPLV